MGNKKSKASAPLKNTQILQQPSTMPMGEVPDISPEDVFPKQRKSPARDELMKRQSIGRVKRKGPTTAVYQIPDGYESRSKVEFIQQLGDVMSVSDLSPLPNQLKYCDDYSRAETIFKDSFIPVKNAEETKIKLYEKACFQDSDWIGPVTLRIELKDGIYPAPEGMRFVKLEGLAIVTFDKPNTE